MNQEIQNPANQKLPLQGAGGAREKILAAVLQNQPALQNLPDITFVKGDVEGAQERYITTLTTIGGKVFKVNSFDEIKALIPTHFDASKRVVSTLPQLSDIAELNQGEPIDPHSLEDIELSIIRAHFGIAENGSVWVTEDLMGQRVLPFICQHLAVVIDAENIVPTMHEAYQRIGLIKYGFGTFIAGPSKTADIEQSLVLGAHGPRSMTVFLLG
ncbi:L-lactate dehydrogenase complex protein LldG [Mucilaginibacter gracilis]|uniref:L-lactate dehydrogenase complex protein LldG n=1 Tax=Mucilaginibacter gracilis TaxID=423350 RepID=A0A495J3D2_9SPHI|nr:LUD domain-containing protein [Mucilaginibacter gracilis]RKR83470.1 L-lactate dehydrogenase complex protein LldG [Mucilaginibacter gracilis]